MFATSPARIAKPSTSQDQMRVVFPRRFVDNTRTAIRERRGILG
ncbi:hypothetical protein BSLA_01r3619 [Burkholderia stabilis]|nr:hypothetical protein BSLA_01r3619 [Burkholderia stabilis]